VKGFVDDRNRALLPIRVASSLQTESTEILAWIDTAFDGHLVFSKELIKKLQLDSLVETEAILTDGSKITMESYWTGLGVRFQYKSLKTMAGFRSWVALSLMRQLSCLGLEQAGDKYYSRIVPNFDASIIDNSYRTTGIERNKRITNKTNVTQTIRRIAPGLAENRDPR
jgi:hypothetical protein